MLKYRSADTQILISRAKNLGFLAENLGEMLFEDALRFFELMAELPDLIAAIPLAGLSCQRLPLIPAGRSLSPRTQSDSRNSLGVIPVHRLKAWVKELTS